jgi:NAD-dependent DNA ligase
VHPRTPENPKHAFAFKQVLSDQTAEAKVLAVEWAASKDGYLKPRVRIEPVKLRGVTIEFVTGFNGKYIQDNLIGVGALLKIVRSGDVIPHILEVVVPAEEPMMPSTQYTWNATGVDILVADLETNPVVRLKRIAGFFSKLEVDGMGIGNTRRIIDAGYNTIPRIIAMSVEDLLTVEGFKRKLAEKIHANINARWTAADLATVMSASGAFGRGFGEKRLRTILNQVPGIITSGDNDVAKVYALNQVEGVAGKTAEQFVAAIPAFMEFVDRTGLHHMLDVVSPDAEDVGVEVEEADTQPKPLQGKKIVITGFRDKDFEKSLEAMGASVSATVSKNTTHVIVKTEADVEGNSTKLVKARKLNALGEATIQIVSRENFGAL